jgi:hypothetical protein
MLRPLPDLFRVALQVAAPYTFRNIFLENAYNQSADYVRKIGRLCVWLARSRALVAHPRIAAVFSSVFIGPHLHGCFSSFLHPFHCAHFVSSSSSPCPELWWTLPSCLCFLLSHTHGHIVNVHLLFDLQRVRVSLRFM